MPGMDGIETLKLAKKMEDNLCKDTPMIALTANAIVGAKEMYETAGFDAYLGKPIKTDELEDLLLKYLPAHLVHKVESVNALREKSSPMIKSIADAILNPKANVPTTSAEAAEDKDSPFNVGVAKTSKRALNGAGSPVAPKKRIDKKMGLHYCAESDELYNDALDIYVEEYEKNVEKLKAAYEACDWKNYCIVAHSIKSTSLTIGAKDCSEIAKLHEFASRENRIDDIKENYEKFLAEFQAAKEEAESIRKNA